MPRVQNAIAVLAVAAAIAMLGLTLAVPRMSLLRTEPPFAYADASWPLPVVVNSVCKMNLHQLNVFAEASLDDSIKLAIVRDLERLYAPLVAEPIPPNLRSYIDRLEGMEGEQLTANGPARST